MRMANHFFIGLLSIVFVCGTVGLLTPTGSQAGVKKGSKVLDFFKKKPAPPCGPGTEGQRFVLFADGTEVCDNTTGRHWQQSPSTDTFEWGPDQDPVNAIDHCKNLNLNGKTWRLPYAKELISLVDYKVGDQADALNAPDGPFSEVRSAFYWSASSLVGNPAFAWGVFFNNGVVAIFNKVNPRQAWCVR